MIDIEELESIKELLGSPLKVDCELYERFLFYTGNLISREREIVKSTYVERNKEDAFWKTIIPFCEDLAKTGNGEAYNLLGIISQEDRDLADGYFKEGMAAGSAYAAMNLAIRTTDIEKKFTLYHWAAEHIMKIDRDDDRGRGILCENLGKMYQLGIGTAPDKEEAERWYRAAIANHNYIVENNLGVLLYKDGRTIEAIRLLTASIKRQEGALCSIESCNRERIFYCGVPDLAICLSLIADEYLIYIDILQLENDKDCNWNELLWGLPDLELDEDYTLDDFQFAEETNSVLRLYARRRSSQHSLKEMPPSYEGPIRPLDVFRFITLPFTEEAIWQAFLLSQAHHLIGMRWHGGYEKRTLIVIGKDIAELHPMFCHSDHLLQLQEQIAKIWNPDLSASVSLYDHYAIVRHCWFDDWAGLSVLKWKIKYDVKHHKVEEIQLEDETLLVRYHCGVLF